MLTSCGGADLTEDINLFSSHYFVSLGQESLANQLSSNANRNFRFTASPAKASVVENGGSGNQTARV